MGFLSKIIFGLRLASAILSEAIKITEPGGVAEVPPAGLGPIVITVEGMKFEIRASVRRLE